MGLPFKYPMKNICMLTKEVRIDCLPGGNQTQGFQNINRHQMIRMFAVSKAADEVLLTCCVLHGRLLEIDGLDNEWQSGVPDILEQATPTEDDDDDDDETTLTGASNMCPDAVWRLQHPKEQRNYDSSGMGPGEDEMHDDTMMDTCIDDFESTFTGTSIDNDAGNLVDTPILVQHFRLLDFYQKVVTHFSIAFRRMSCNGRDNL